MTTIEDSTMNKEFEELHISKRLPAIPSASNAKPVHRDSLTVNKSQVGLGLGRRPSDNLLRSFAHEERIPNETTSFNPDEFSPPRGKLIDRPVSNDSIGTRSSGLFSSPSSDLNSGSSSIENEIGEEALPDENDESLDSIENVPATRDPRDFIISSKSKQTFNDMVTPSKTFFRNGTKAKSQVCVVPQGSLPMRTLQNSNNGNLVSNAPKMLPNQRLYKHANSTSAILANKVPLTPSQRYRLRREQNEKSIRSTIRKKEKYYDQQDQVIELQDGDIDDSLVWDIPMASFLTTSFLTKSNNTSFSQSPALRQSPLLAPPNAPFQSGKQRTNSPTHNCRANSNPPVLDYKEMPTSPIPGINKVSDLQYMQDTSMNLSSVYLHSTNTISKSKLLERTESAECLPLEFKEASERGMEDLLLVSEDKLGVVSHSRPSWLPPKDSKERKLHEREISKSMSIASIEQLDRNKEREERLIRDETNRQKYVLLLERDITRNSSLQSCKKVIWETAFGDDTRRSAYDEILQSKTGLVTEKYIESFDGLMKTLKEMDFIEGKTVELKALIKKAIETKISGRSGMSSDLLLMLQLKSISHEGLLPGDELLFHHLLLCKSFTSLKQVWEMVNLIQLTCFNDACKEKYDSNIIDPRGVVAHYLLKDPEFQKEFTSSCLNYPTIWNVLERVDHSLFMWILDAIVVANNQCFSKHPVKQNDYQDKDWDYYRSKKVVVNYKIIASLILNVLLNYHFGFNDLQQLSSVDDEKFCIPIPFDDLLDMEAVNGVFMKKWQHYYNKF
ncbi:hypothetical protein NCAS_0H01950 [Naumovozyma castellii]|uniref:Protein SBE22 n=1 Tax=Naumovozyma castellii TaxID=27288 RepID=G0VJ27_NAUCA|nr:hypothetical protein NCAS_0H01950 [Naumovozyma castellii CBS 4309]CCC71505.1 hypothetical protein NCAS_0H01950 [Naumovozyma castellii CBS 4309]